MDTEIWLPRFCGNDSIQQAFWSDELTVYTESPVLTNCFQQTILIWVPSAILLFGCCISLPDVFQQIPETPGRGISKLGVLQIVDTVMLILLKICELIYTILNEDHTQPSYFSAVIISICTYGVVVAVHTIASKRGHYNLGVFFIFWLLSLLCSSAAFWSDVVKEGTNVGFTAMHAINLCLLLVQVICSFIPDKKCLGNDCPKLEESYPLLVASSSSNAELREQPFINPTLICSFPSYFLFSWFTPLVIKGYKSDLVLQDIWRQKKLYQAKNEMTEFKKHWLERTEHFQFNQYRSRSYSNENTEMVKRPRTEGTAWPLFIALWRTSGASFIPAIVLIFGYFTCLLLNPFLLEATIKFIEADDTYSWHGYTYAVGMFLLGLLGSICFHNHLFISFTGAMQIRTVLTTAIYRKSLKLSVNAKKKNTMGEIVNLMSVDVQKVQDSLGYLFYLFPIPALLVFALYFLWQQLGPSCFAGLIYMFAILPMVSLYNTRKLIRLQGEQMLLKVERIKIVNQVLSGIKVLKLNAWEPYFETRLIEIRKQETDNLRSFWISVGIANALFVCTPFIVGALCFTAFVLSNPNHLLTAEVAFVSLSYLNILSLPINYASFIIMQCAQGFVSLRRIAQFLQEEEYNPHDVKRSEHSNGKGIAVSVSNGTFSWGDNESAALRGISMNLYIKGLLFTNKVVWINLDIPQGQLIAVIGEVGSGKSSILAAILGQIIKIQGAVEVTGSQAFVPQHPWIQNMSLRDNVLFGKEFDAERYDVVLARCALKHDLELLPGGDMTEIGERGINLSGGQKQRLSLARAVYQDADIYLMDDPLSAVDSRVGKHIFNNIIGPDGCLQHRTRLFVTSQIQYLKKCNEIIVLEKGCIVQRGNFDELIQVAGPLAQYVKRHTNEPSSDSILPARKRTFTLEAEFEPLNMDLEKTKNDNTNLLAEEEMAKGNIAFPVLKWYIGSAKTIQIVLITIGLVYFIAAQSFTNIWLAAWSNDAERMASNESVPSVYVRLGVYAALGFGQGIGTSLFTISLAFATVEASKNIHRMLIKNVLRSPMSFFDTTPIGRILNRFSKDVVHLDKDIPGYLQDLLIFSAPLVATFVVIIYSEPIFTVIFIPMVLLYTIIQRAYATSARQLKRLDSLYRSPQYNFFSETLSGTVSIRAYSCEQRFIERNDYLLDKSQGIWFTVYTSGRWINLNGEIIAAFVVLFVTIFAINQQDTISAGLAGLAITYSLQFSMDLTTVLRTASELETYAVAVERLKEYSEVKQEAPWRLPDAIPPDGWPQYGAVEFHCYSARYRPDLDLVLREISLKINASEKIGIVGRTGAGKSSLALALFRVLEASSGFIKVDGLDISKFGLHDVRSRLTVIPQDPVLFSGTLRFNIDPANAYDDEAIWDAIEHANLKTFVENLPHKLQHECGEDGSNLSVGQRQLICLARALLRTTRVLVLDEATASVDMETDWLIQKTIRENFQYCTIITVAHRLNTVLDYDRVLVMDRGKVIEFDTPQHLIADRNSKFHQMIVDAGLFK